MKLLPWLLSASLLASCSSANRHLRQAEKHLKKAEQLGAKVRVDTFYVDREIIVPDVKFDTVTAFKTLSDTITITKDNIITKIKVDTISKRVYVSVKCPPDTVRIRVPVTVTKEINAEFPWGWLVLAFCAGSILGLLASRKVGS